MVYEVGGGGCPPVTRGLNIWHFYRSNPLQNAGPWTT